MTRFLALAGILLLYSIPSAAQVRPMSAENSRSRDLIDKQFDFNGFAQLRISHDSMTDREVCYAQTQNFEGAWIMATGTSAALVSTTNNIFVDYEQPALLRIGDSAPFALSRSQRAHAIAVPAARVPELVRALYTQQRVRVRLVEWPDGAVFDGEIKPGDFAAAYDRGVQLCAWPKLSVAAVHPAAEPQPAPELLPSMDVSGASCVYCPLQPVFDGQGAKPGTITLRATLGSDGRASDVSLVRDSGTGLDASVEDAVRRWRFAPASNDPDRSLSAISIVIILRARASAQ